MPTLAFYSGKWVRWGHIIVHVSARVQNLHWNQVHVQGGWLRSLSRAGATVRTYNNGEEELCCHLGEGDPYYRFYAMKRKKNSSLIPNFTRQMKMFQIKGHLLLFGITTDNVTVLKCPTFRWPFTQFTFFIMAHLSLGYDFCLVWKYKDFVLQTLMNLIKNHILMNRCLTQVMFVEFIQFFWWKCSCLHL